MSILTCHFFFSMPFIAWHFFFFFFFFFLLFDKS